MRFNSLRNNDLLSSATAIRSRKSSRNVETIPVDLFELERLIGDLCIWINDMNGPALQHQLCDLCDRLEAAEKYGDGMLEEI